MQEIVVGPGALGLLLGLSLIERPLFVGRSTAPLFASVQYDNGTVVSDQLRLYSWAELAGMVRSDVVLYVCVPPQNTEEVLYQIVQFAKQFEPRRSLTAVVCSNGIWCAPLNSASLNSPQIRWVRAICLVGVQTIRRSKDERHVRHMNGRTIYYEALCSETWTPPPSAFDWKRVEHIERTEILKFYANVMLALVIGPRDFPNGSLYQIVEPSMRLELARDFASVFGEVTAEDCEQFLRETIDKTSSNRNSISKAWMEGNLGPIHYLLNVVSEKLGTTQEPAANLRSLVHQHLQTLSSGARS